MKWCKKKYRKLVEWLKPSYKAEFIKEIPEIFAEKTVYIVGEKNEPWVLTFECPCGCKNIILLNTLLEAKPRWKFKVLSNNKIDISPSVWRISGCKSHFYIRKGKLYWC